MGELFGPNSPFYGFIKKVSDIAVLNFWWVVTSLPIVTMGASCTAMAACAIKLAQGRESTVTQDYWAAFKANWKQGSQIFFILLPAAVLLGIDLYFWYKQGGQMGNIMLIISLCLCVVWLLEFLYVFAMQAYYENTLANTMRNALLFAWRNPLPTLRMLVFVVLAVLLNCTIIYVNLFTLLFGFGWLAYLLGKGHATVFEMHRLRQKAMQEKQEEKTDDETEK